MYVYKFISFCENIIVILIIYKTNIQIISTWVFFVTDYQIKMFCTIRSSIIRLNRVRSYNVKYFIIKSTKF